MQLVSRHVIENSGDLFKSSVYAVSESGWPSSDSSWQCYYTLGTTTKLSMPFQVLKEIFFLGLGLTVTEKRYRDEALLVVMCPTPPNLHKSQVSSTATVKLQRSICVCMWTSILPLHCIKARFLLTFCSKDSTRSVPRLLFVFCFKSLPGLSIIQCYFTLSLLRDPNWNFWAKFVSNTLSVCSGLVVLTYCT